MFHTGKPSWPVERTLVTSGALDFLLVSKRDGGKVVETPALGEVRYETSWRWKEPPPPPQGRPLDGE